MGVGKEGVVSTSRPYTRQCITHHDRNYFGQESAGTHFMSSKNGAQAAAKAICLVSSANPAHTPTAVCSPHQRKCNCNLQTCRAITNTQMATPNTDLATDAHANDRTTDG